MADQTVLFAGGGTGGHLFPALAVAEVLAEQADAPALHFACSDRAIDARLLGGAGAAYTPLGVRPWPRRPWNWPSFLVALRRARAESAGLIRAERVGLVVALGGFVSGPVVSAARRSGRRVPSLLINLDAVPGRANRLAARLCDRVCSVHVAAGLPAGTEIVAMPLRRSVLSGGDQGADRAALGLDAAVPVLLVTGASQGARSV
ncbi:MAG: glycosyltransferase, partial [Phycisphaerae bacterium]|nr:glycosyltransferase [Phycisphaerae bacterium]